MRKQRIVTVSVLFLAVEVKCERLTLAVIVLDHDFERLSLGRECVVIEGEMPRRDGVAIIRRERFTASADAQRSTAVILEIAQGVARAIHDAFGHERAAYLDIFARHDGFRDGHRGDLERVNRSHVQTAITAAQAKPGHEQGDYRPCCITDVLFHGSLRLEVETKACRYGRPERVDVRAEEKQPATAQDKEQVIRQEQLYSKMQPAASDKARTALCSLSMSAFDWRTLVASIRIFSRTSGWISPDKTSCKPACILSGQ